MTKPKSLTQIFTTKDVPKEYAELFRDIYRANIGAGAEVTQADLLSEAIYDLAVKHFGENIAEASLSGAKFMTGGVEPKAAPKDPEIN
ncbi:hypothetical protein [Alteromonas sp. a30]|uniref:hypothetical protein n=1 Tax=Alteromonas sp. a30 TaxID=2730917 RepID=UPI00227FB5FD|nr:hypothetical protein [Alteromonas sp. a30]MCY7297380.1 hypothetical protein [Alteromonas sp. a30]